MSAVEDHHYSPSIMHMGDCQKCGNVQNAPMHIGTEAWKAAHPEVEMLAGILAKSRGWRWPLDTQAHWDEGGTWRDPARDLREQAAFILKAMVPSANTPSPDERDLLSEVLVRQDRDAWPDRQAAPSHPIPSPDPAHIAALQARVAELEGERDQLADKNEELRQAPWPEWTTKCLDILREFSGYDGYDDATEGVDLPSELQENIEEAQRQIDAATTRATTAEQRVKELEGALKIARHDLVVSSNLRATDLGIEVFNAHLSNNVPRDQLEWTTDNSRGIAAIDAILSAQSADTGTGEGHTGEAQS